MHHNPSVLDTVTAVVAYANGDPAQPWWVFSWQRKAGTAPGSTGED